MLAIRSYCLITVSLTFDSDLEVYFLSVETSDLNTTKLNCFSLALKTFPRSCLFVLANQEFFYSLN